MIHCWGKKKAGTFDPYWELEAGGLGAGAGGWRLDGWMDAYDGCIRWMHMMAAYRQEAEGTRRKE